MEFLNRADLELYNFLPISNSSFLIGWMQWKFQDVDQSNYLGLRWEKFYSQHFSLVWIQAIARHNYNNIKYLLLEKNQSIPYYIYTWQSSVMHVHRIRVDSTGACWVNEHVYLILHMLAEKMNDYCFFSSIIWNYSLRHAFCKVPEKFSTNQHHVYTISIHHKCTQFLTFCESFRLYKIVRSK